LDNGTTDPERPMDLYKLAQLARYQPDKMAKVELTSSKHLICGLNCFEPGQAQKSHAHKGADKLYYVVEGRGEFSVGAEQRTLSAGELLYVPENAEHGVANTSGARLSVLIVITPNLHG
jgi:quercetin dioxygenase-like cupin family protein